MFSDNKKKPVLDLNSDNNKEDIVQLAEQLYVAQ